MQRDRPDVEVAGALGEHHSGRPRCRAARRGRIPQRARRAHGRAPRSGRRRALITPMPTTTIAVALTKRGEDRRPVVAEGPRASSPAAARGAWRRGRGRARRRRPGRARPWRRARSNGRKGPRRPRPATRTRSMTRASHEPARSGHVSAQPLRPSATRRRTSGRSSGWVSPMQRLFEATTCDAGPAGRHGRADDVGQEELGRLALLVGRRLGVEGVEGVVDLVEHRLGETPQVHAHLLVAAQLVHGRGLGPGDRGPLEAAVGAPPHLVLDDPGQIAVGAGLAQPPGDLVVGDDRVAQVGSRRARARPAGPCAARRRVS